MSTSTPPVGPKRAFIAGATGFTGRALALQPTDGAGVQLALQVRPGSSSIAKLEGDDRIVEVALDDEAALAAALEGMDAVVQLIGTVRANFNEQTSYESVDYGTTVKLVGAARRAGVEHFVLLSSVGAGMGLGSYLSWKKKTERAVTESGLGYTILRPSYLAGDEVMTERRAARYTSAFLGGMSDSPVGYPFAAIRPINIQVLAQIILEVIRQGPRNRVLMGQGLFQIARRLGLHAPSVVSQLS
jgi:nucleoside-diphosphate-sugar epimerase